ncbi:MAG: hypothetical protein AAF351_11815 [Pseudomonadota bacterium]
MTVACLTVIAACGGSGSGNGGNGGNNMPPVVPPVAAPSCLADVPFIHDRSLVDRVDDVSGPKLHLVYALPADAADAELDINGQIQTEMEVALRWLREQTGRCMRVDTFDDAVDVTFVRFSRTNQQMRTDPDFVDQTVALEFEALGLDDPEKVYVVYYGGSTDNGGCGGAAAIGGPAMQYLVNQNVTDGPLTSCPFFTFVAGPDANFRGSWAAVAVHEAFHSLGMVPTCAPDHDDQHPLHLETISSDLMAFDGTGFSTYTLDANRSEYYGHSNIGCPDLSASAIWEDAAVGADPLPLRTTYTSPQPISCADESVTQSNSGGAAVSIRLVNATEAPVNFYELDSLGIRLSPLTANPFSALERTANQGEVFVATDANSGECLGLYELVAGSNRIVIAD